MTTSYTPPPPPPRRLTRSRTNKVAGGVCGGVAHYLNMDPTLVRVLTVLITLVTGPIPLVLYLVALFVMPQEDAPSGPYPGVYGPQPSPYDYAPGVDVPQYAPAPSPGPAPQPPRGHDPLWGTEGAPWEQATRPAPPPSASPVDGSHKVD